ncbi:MAG TPA: ABC transporter permease [Thermoanaerobaculia bacterium]|nr:ABC transporter permease [Thermoanaerobaculia bacterium]
MVELFLWRLSRCRAGDRARRQVARLWRSVLADLLATAALEATAPLRRKRAVAAHVQGRIRPERLSTRTEDRMHLLTHDFSTALRRLRRTPLFTLSAVTIVAIGIGANTAGFTLVDAFLLRPLGYHEPERLVHVYQDSDDGEPSSTSYPAYRDMARFTDVFEGVAATSIANATWERESGPTAAMVEYATASLFPVLGLRPRLGRWFTPAEDHVGAGAFAVVSHWTWTRKMGADPAVVGSTIRLEGQPVTVVGVGPERYNGSGGALVTDFWLSISSTPVGGPFRVRNLERREDHWYDVMARLAPGVTVAQARGAMTVLADRLATQFPELNRDRRITVFGTDEVRIHPEVDAQILPSATMILVVVGLVLLLSCSNLANLLLVRGVSRAPEVAVRRALGASSSRVIGLFLCEALIIAAAGGIAGFALARSILLLVPELPLPMTGTLDLTMDSRIALFTIGLVLLSATFFGGLPALRIARMKAGFEQGKARGAGGGRASELLRRVMVGVQVAVSLVLLVAAALFGRSLVHAAAVDPGVEIDRVAYLQTSLSRRGLSPTELAIALTEIADRLSAIPGVTGISLASRLPVQNVGGSSTTVIEGYEPATGDEGAVELLVSTVSESYFRTLGIPLRAGRSFGAQDAADGAATALVNETAARRYWGDPQAAIGRRIRPQAQPDAWIEVVGVVADSRVRTLTEPPTPLLYRPLDQAPLASPYLIARSEGPAEALVQELRANLDSIDPTLPVRAAGTLGAHVGEALLAPRALALVIGGFSAVAMLLASFGIHAVVAFSVASRTAELGVRVALGARRGRIVGLVVREVLTTVAAGLVLGLAGALAVMRLFDGLLFGVRGLDPLSFAAASAVLVLAAIAASFLPALRAATLDPVIALRTD